MTNVLIKIRNLETQTHTPGECHVNMMADPGGASTSQTKDCPKLPEAKRET